eukprot:353300-Chlamydomonas_euryale.AAC.3
MTSTWTTTAGGHTLSTTEGREECRGDCCAEACIHTFVVAFVVGLDGEFSLGDTGAHLSSQPMPTNVASGSNKQRKAAAQRPRDAMLSADLQPSPHPLHPSIHPFIHPSSITPNYTVTDAFQSNALPPAPPMRRSTP